MCPRSCGVLLLVAVACFAALLIGSIPAARAANPPPCATHIHPLNGEGSVLAGTNGLGAVRVDTCANNSGSASVSMNGSTENLGPGVDQNNKPVPNPDFVFDPCRLPDGSDLPGAKVDFSFVGVDPSASANASFTLGDDSDPPEVKVTSTPAVPSKVKPGDTISVQVDASEEYSEAPGAVTRKSWQTGVKSIQILADDGVVDSKEYGGLVPEACAGKSWKQTFTATYTIPQNAPPIIHLRAVAEDFQGNQATKTAEFPTGDAWEGTYRVHAGLGGLNDAIVAIDFSLLVGADGAITGTGRAHVTFVPARTPEAGPCTNTWSVNLADLNVTFGGRRNGDELDLKVEQTPIMLTDHIDCKAPLRSAMITVPEGLLTLMSGLDIPKVNAADGATNSLRTPFADGAIEIHRPKQTAGK